MSPVPVDHRCAMFGLLIPWTMNCRKRQVTKERQQKAAEKVRLEAMAAKVSTESRFACVLLSCDARSCTDPATGSNLIPIHKMSAKKLARKKRRMGITKKVAHAK